MWGPEMSSDKYHSLVRRIFFERRATEMDEEDDGAAAGTQRPATVIELLSDIVACPGKTENAVRLLTTVLRYLAIFLLIFLAIVLVIVAALSHWRPSVHIPVDRAVRPWIVGLSASATSVVVTTLLSRIVRGRSAQKKEKRAKPHTKVESGSA
jgi:hypothetical protein